MGISIKNAQMKEAFINGGDYPKELNHASEESMHKNQKLGLDSYINNSKEHKNDSISVTEPTNTSVKLRYHYYAFNAQPQTDNDKSEIQKNNRALLEAYHKAKELALISYKYDSTDKSKRLLYTNDPNLLTVANFIQAFKDTGFLRDEGRNEWIMHATGENTYQILQNLLNGTHDNLANSVVGNMVSFSYGKEYYSELFNVAQKVKPAISKLNITSWNEIKNIMNNSDDKLYDIAENIASGFASRTFTDGRTTGYFYEFYEPWYKEFLGVYEINKSPNDYSKGMNHYYNINHFPGLVFATEFLLEKVSCLKVVHEGGK